MTFKDFTAYVGAAIFVFSLAVAFSMSLDIRTIFYTLIAAVVGGFSVWGFVTVLEKHMSVDDKTTEINAEDFRKMLEDCKHPTHKRSGVNVNPDPTYPKPPAPPSPPPTTETIRKRI